VAVKIDTVKPPIRLLGVDIDGTLLNPEFQISPADLAALRRAHAEGVEVVVVTGRRHTFALPIVQQLGFDLWIISSNGAITRSLAGETFHRDQLPADTCRKLCADMREFRGSTVLTFDTEAKGAIVLEHMNELSASIQRWLEKNLEYINFVIPIEDSLTRDPVQAMFCGSIPRMQQALATLAASGLDNDITVLRTEWAGYRGIPRKEVMAIGDNYNDIEMLAFAGVPFIMGNAAAELRREGWTVTLPNDQNGVAAAIEQVLGVS
jgi:HAD superfamily hydrolase (TIGR01484 family)